PASEIVLVLDGPVGEELENVVKKWVQLLPIKILRLSENVGLGKALNFGLDKCNYDLVARMDTDDICHPDRFMKQCQFLTSSDVDICGTYAYDIDENESIIGERTVPIHMDDIRRLIWSCPIIHPSVMYRKKSILGMGSYNPSVAHRQEDYELWIRCVDSGLKFYNISSFLLYYRYPAGSENKNSVSVGINRFKLGYKAIIKYDRRFMSLMGLLYPCVRALLPGFFRAKLVAFVKQRDPRRT
ncbi:glycosyltransferase, partial [Shewanella sp.]|nr:glycosyltransferase [Shewanella sp.]